MARRLPSPPPVLSGFTHLHVLGSGGFADVFLYEQNMPRRQVAVKVILSEVVNEQVRQMFQAEANLMAQLSSHPSILTVYQASVSCDGRPYLVMEFCSSGLSDRYRRERIPVPEVLRIAVKIGSAIETAHRAGVLHRDIKPSNILLTAYGHPVLSDFGIASTLGEVENQDAVGMSIPWSAPEVLDDETPGTIASEVWSFAATVYTLLAGRSPFEVAGESNKRTDLTARIVRARPQPIGRPDVPTSLERALQRGMSRRPESRQHSILELVREIQAIETELGVLQTPVEIAVDDWALSSMSHLEERTLIRPVGGTPAATGSRRRRRRTSAVAPRPEYAADSAIPPSPPQAARSAAAAPLATTRTFRWVAVSLAAAAVLVVGLGALVTTTLVRASADAIPVVVDVDAQTASDAVEFSWPDPGLLPSDSYQISATDRQPIIQTGRQFSIASSGGERVCITVTVNRDGKTGAASIEKCVVVES